MLSRLILLAALLSSCGVSQKVPKNKDKAKEYIINHKKAITKIAKYHDLTDTILVNKETDTVRIESVKVKIRTELVKDTTAFDSLLNEYVNVEERLNDSLSLSRNLEAKYRELREKLRERIIKGFIKDTTITASNLILISTKDTSFYVTLELEAEFYQGKLRVESRTNRILVPYISKETTSTIDANIRKNFWEDFKFWLLILLVLGVIFRKEITKSFGYLIKIIKPL